MLDKPIPTTPASAPTTPQPAARPRPRRPTPDPAPPHPRTLPAGLLSPHRACPLPALLLSPCRHLDPPPGAALGRAPRHPRGRADQCAPAAPFRSLPLSAPQRRLFSHVHQPDGVRTAALVVAFWAAVLVALAVRTRRSAPLLRRVQPAWDPSRRRRRRGPGVRSPGRPGTATRSWCTCAATGSIRDPAVRQGDHAGTGCGTALGRLGDQHVRPRGSAPDQQGLAGPPTRR